MNSFFPFSRATTLPRNISSYLAQRTLILANSPIKITDFWKKPGKNRSNLISPNRSSESHSFLRFPVFFRCKGNSLNSPRKISEKLTKPGIFGREVNSLNRESESHSFLRFPGKKQRKCRKSTLLY